GRAHRPRGQPLGGGRRLRPGGSGRPPRRSPRTRRHRVHRRRPRGTPHRPGRGRRLGRGGRPGRRAVHGNGQHPAVRADRGMPAGLRAHGHLTDGPHPGGHRGGGRAGRGGRLPHGCGGAAHRDRLPRRGGVLRAPGAGGAAAHGGLRARHHRRGRRYRQGVRHPPVRTPGDVRHGVRGTEGGGRGGGGVTTDLRYNVGAFILTHGRPDRVLTYRLLKRSGYTGPIHIVIDNEDSTAEEYRAKFPNVHVFDKAAVARTFDTADLSDNRKAVVFARNAAHALANELGYSHYIELDDDYDYFSTRFEVDGKLPYARMTDMNHAVNITLDFLEASGALTVAWAQGGDLIGGLGSSRYAASL